MEVSASSESDSEEEVSDRGKNSESMKDDTKRKPSFFESKLGEFEVISKNEKMFVWMEAS